VCVRTSGLVLNEDAPAKDPVIRLHPYLSGKLKEHQVVLEQGS